jgi:hypothetical protein
MRGKMGIYHQNLEASLGGIISGGRTNGAATNNNQIIFHGHLLN